MAAPHVCPWWLAYTFDNPLRGLVHNPGKILSGYVSEGMTVMDVGCGMGHFTLGLARLVGERGHVIAVDLQQQMLNIMMKRALRKGLAQRIMPHCATPAALGVTTPVDFGLAFWMIHEVPDPAAFFEEMATILKSSAKLLYAEPAFHVSLPKYRVILAFAEKAGFSPCRNLAIPFSRAVLLGNRS
jgi:ubiquinone/menaquinone biosynthesis C-methylase UbiE